MIVALLAIAIGATILSGLITIYIDVPKQMGAQFRNYGANMLLTPREDASISQEDFEKCISIFSEEDLVGASPYCYQTVRVHDNPVQVAATDMESLQKTSPYWAIDGDYPSQAGQILLGENVAENFGMNLGQTYTLSFHPEEDAELDKEVDFLVVGIVSTGGKEEDYMYMTFQDMEDLTGKKTEYDLAELSVSADKEGLDAYIQKISNSIASINPSLIKRVTASETTVLSKLQALVLLVTIVVLALTIICVASTMTAVVSERRKEIGLRKAIGASDKSIIAEFMGEGMTLGAMGGFVGSFVGFAFAQFVSVQVFGSQIYLQQTRMCL